VTPEDKERFFEIINKWDVEASIIGTLTGDGRLTIDHFGHRIVDVDPKTVAHDGPVYDRPYARPAWQDELQANTSASLKRPETGGELLADINAVISNVNQASKAWVTDQYDRYVQGNTALAQPDDAGVIRVDEETGLGVALATDANGWYTKLDPREGALQALAESYRNVAIVGAEPVAITDCLNFGNPEDTDAMWQLVTAMTGLADGCIELGVPVTGGNVSLYNSSGTEKNLPTSSINPTPVVGMLGIMKDVTRANPSGFTEEGLAVILLGQTQEELDGSAWARICHDHLGGRPPKVDLKAEVALGNVVRALSEADGPDGRPLIRSAHDLSNGGLAQALVDSVLRFGIGGAFDLTGAQGQNGLSDFDMLFSESQARAIIAVPEGALDAVYAACQAEGIDFARIGTTGGDMLVLHGSD
ncbi:MAG: AIR synthase related protein, partial [Actinomycetaceae bacterium UMB1218B]|nr:AIR synthase related protein [Actinomycetaceae bacterium UMB1218B]